MNELALFTGAGGGVLGSQLLGWRVVCGVEFDPYCREVLLRRQEDGFIEPFPVWDDVRTFDGTAWRGKVDIVTGGFPCQPFSVAGKRKGKDDERNLWPDTCRIIREVGPAVLLLENVPGIRRYLSVVVRDLRRIGYLVSEPIVISAAEMGAGHIRKRFWVFADTGSTRFPAAGRRTAHETMDRGDRASRDNREDGSEVGWWSREPGVGRVVYGLPYGVDRLKALGNGQVPRVVVEAWGRLGGERG